MRLDKSICKSTEFSRIEAIERIRAGLVCVDGKPIIDETAQIHQNNTVTLDGEKLSTRDFRYLLFNKPLNTVCSNVDEHYPSILNWLSIERTSELHIAGRLDANTTGLVLITDDGHWSYNITVPTRQCKKTYRVGLSRSLTADAVQKLKEGILLQGETTLTLPAALVFVAEKEVLLTITEGRFHQVKRMFAAVGNRVTSLHREQIGELVLDVKEGQWRYLTAGEIQSFSNNAAP